MSICVVIHSMLFHMPFHFIPMHFTPLLSAPLHSTLTSSHLLHAILPYYSEVISLLIPSYTLIYRYTPSPHPHIPPYTLIYRYTPSPPSLVTFAYLLNVICTLPSKCHTAFQYTSAQHTTAQQKQHGFSHAKSSALHIYTHSSPSTIYTLITIYHKHTHHHLPYTHSSPSTIYTLITIHHIHTHRHLPYAHSSPSTIYTLITIHHIHTQVHTHHHLHKLLINSLFYFAHPYSVNYSPATYIVSLLQLVRYLICFHNIAYKFISLDLIKSNPNPLF